LRGFPLLPLELLDDLLRLLADDLLRLFALLEEPRPLLALDFDFDDFDLEPWLAISPPVR
jgi:hypothetical protein